MAAATSFLASLVQILVPQPCFDEFFTKFNFFHGGCLKIVISKGLGFAIILGSLVVKVPQIIKIVNAKSAKGINLVGVSLELTAITSSFVYGYVNSFPFSSYGEAVFLMIQTLIIAALVLLYGGQTTGSLLYTAVFGGILAFLLSPACPRDLHWLLQMSNMPNIIVARMLQAYDNFRNGSTGQLSVITVFMLWAGSLARIFTSAQETGDITVISTFIVAFTCNSVIFAQMIYYWNAKPEAKKQ